MYKRINVKKLAVSIMAAILLLCLYVLIFSFSEQDADTSGSLSHMISEKCVEIFNTLAGGNWTDSFRAGLADYFENPIRKLAHFTEYACMGILVYLLWRPWKERDKKLYWLVLIWVFLSAMGDEIHQLFVPGRSGNAADVLLDTCGGGFGQLIGVVFEKLYDKRSVKRMEKNKKCT